MSTATEPQPPQAPRLKQKYHDEVKGALKSELGLANVMQVPTLEKIVINMGVGRATQQPSLLEGAVATSPRSAGQKPIITKAASRSPASSSARASRSAARSRCAATGCGSSSTG